MVEKYQCEKFQDIKGLIIAMVNRQWTKKTKMFDKLLRKQKKIEQHEPHYNSRLNSDASEVILPIMALIVLLFLNIGVQIGTGKYYDNWNIFVLICDITVIK